MSAPDRAARPPSRPTPAPVLPKFREFRTDGGLRVRAARVTRLPEVAVRLVIGAGAATEPAGRAGATALAVRVLPEGAAGRSAREMALWLDHLGAGYGAGAGHDGTEFSLHALAPTIDEAMAYLEAVILAPAFDPAEVDRLRREAIDAARRDRDDPAAVADEVLAARVFGGHPYGRPTRGTEPTLAALGPGDVRDAWARVFREGPAVLVAAGDLEPEAFAAAAARRFESWNVATRAEAAPSAPPPVPVPVRFLHRPGSRQSEIRIGTIGFAHGAADEMPARVLNAVLGGLFNSRLNLNLREDKGWTYGVRSGFTPLRAPGPFVIRTAVETPATGPAVEEMWSEARGMRERPPEGPELDLARRSLILSLPLRFETTSQVVAREAQRVASGLPEDWWSRFPGAVTAVERDDVAAAADRYLDPDRLVTVVVGDADAARPGLGALGAVEETEIS